jgi:hypothetical protein
VARRSTHRFEPAPKHEAPTRKIERLLLQLTDELGGGPLEALVAVRGAAGLEALAHALGERWPSVERIARGFYVVNVVSKTHANFLRVLTSFFAASDRAVAALLELVERATRPGEVWNGTPEHLRGRPLPPVPTPARWGVD